MWGSVMIFCLILVSAESLIDQVVGRRWFDPVMIYGVSGVKVHEGEKAREVLLGSYEADWDLDVI